MCGSWAALGVAGTWAVGPAGSRCALGPRSFPCRASNLQVLQVLQLGYLLHLGRIGSSDSEHLVPGQSRGALNS